MTAAEKYVILFFYPRPRGPADEEMVVGLVGVLFVAFVLFAWGGVAYR